MLLPKITQDNVHVFIHLNVSRVTEMIAKNIILPGSKHLWIFIIRKSIVFWKRKIRSFSMSDLSYIFMAYNMEKRGE